MININRIQSASFQLVESRYYPSIQLALGLITALGAFYLIKKDSSFFSVKKAFILSGSLSSLSFMVFNFHLKGSIDKGAYGCYQLAQVALARNSSFFYHHYMELCVKVAPGDNQAEKFYQVALIARGCGDQLIDDHYMKLSVNEGYYQTAQIAFQNANMKEWFDSITLAADGGHLQASQELTHYYYDTGLLISAKYYSDPIAHPDLSTLINKELDKINNWNTLPLRTVVYTDTYHPSNKVFCYPEQVKNIICFNSPRDTIFNTFQEVEEVIYEVQEEGEEVDIFIRENLSKLEKLKIFEFKSSGPLCASRRKELIKNLKKPSLLTSLKINTGFSTSSLTTLDLSSFPYLKTLHLNQPTIVSNFDKSSLTDVSLVFDFFSEASYSEFMQRKNLKNLEFLSLVVETNSIDGLDLSYLESIKILKIKSDSENILVIHNLNRGTDLKTIHSVIKQLRSCENLSNLAILGCPSLFSNHDFINQFREISVNLESLSLCHNQLNNISFIPFAMLTKLRHLHLYNNSISTLPNDLAQLPSSCTVHLMSNELNVNILRNFQITASRVQLRDPQHGPNLNIYPNVSIPLSAFESILDFWSQKIKNNNLKFDEVITNIKKNLPSGDEQQILARFLLELIEIEDYQNYLTQPNVVKRVADLLTCISKNKDFQENALKMIGDNLADCHDRITTVFDELEILVALHDEEKTLQEKAKLVIGFHRYRLLQQKIHKISTEEGFGDEIELLLYAQLSLTKRLELPISTQNMLYRHVGAMISPHIDRIETEILKATSSLDDCCLILTNYKQWDDHLKKQYPTEFEKIKTIMDEKMEDLDSKALPSQQYNEECKEVQRLYENENKHLIDTLNRKILSRFISSSSSSSSY